MNLQVCKSTSLQVYEFASLQVTNVQVYKFTSLQVYKFTSLQVYKLTSLQVYKFISLQAYKFTIYKFIFIRLFQIPNAVVTSVPLTTNDVQAGNSRYCGRFLNTAGGTTNASVCCEYLTSEIFLF